MSLRVSDPLELTVTWQPPPGTGTVGLSGWLVQSRPVGPGSSWVDERICDVGERSHTLTGLTEGVRYEARVFPLRGVCADAVKDFDVVSGTAAGTALDKPDRMAGVSLTSGIGFVTVSWTAPASDGGSSIARYEIRHKTADEADYTLVPIEDATARTHTFTGLEEGIELTVQVRAVNSRPARRMVDGDDRDPQRPGAAGSSSDARLSADSAGSFKLVTIGFDESLDSGSEPAPARFGVNVGADTAAPATVAVDGDTVVLTMAAEIDAGKPLSVTYTDPSGDNSAGVVQDPAGNDAATFTKTLLNRPGPPRNLAQINGTSNIHASFRTGLGVSWDAPGFDGLGNTGGPDRLLCSPDAERDQKWDLGGQDLPSDARSGQSTSPASELSPLRTRPLRCGSAPSTR